ncbi:hypothetical protein ACLGI4_18655 [Streptomyces sp. HMX112]|uniref:hypothetical protein n=1 Tax=Streptomyces sp. HMX112 TaxID=3390850 RepID=UPI003A8075C3
MPRPNVAQLAYGSATVVLSTVAMLLLSRATGGLGIALIGLAALLLGLLVALSVPATGRRAQPARAALRRPTGRAETGPAVRVPRPRARTGEHSLRR